MIWRLAPYPILFLPAAENLEPTGSSADCTRHPPFPYITESLGCKLSRHVFLLDWIVKAEILLEEVLSLNIQISARTKDLNRMKYECFDMLIMGGGRYLLKTLPNLWIFLKAGRNLKNKPNALNILRTQQILFRSHCKTGALCITECWWTGL